MALNLEELQQRVLTDFLQTHPVAQNLTEAYRRFLEVDLAQLIEYQHIQVSHQRRTETVTFKNVCFFPPQYRQSDGSLRTLTIEEAIKRKTTLALRVVADVTHHCQLKSLEPNGEPEELECTYEQLKLVDIPVMIGTFPDHDWLAFDADQHSCLEGSFIINGVPKVLVNVCKLVYNEPVIKKGTGKVDYFVEVRSLPEATPWKSTATLFIEHHEKSGLLYCKCHRFSLPNSSKNIEIPIRHIVEFLGIHSLLEFLVLVEAQTSPVVFQYLRQLLEITWYDTTIKNRQQYAVKLRKSPAAVQQLFDENFLPHTSAPDGTVDQAGKIQFLIGCLAKLVGTKYGLFQMDSREHLRYKCVWRAGDNVAFFFRQAWDQFTKSVREKISTILKSPSVSPIVRIERVFQSTSFTTLITQHFNSGNLSLHGPGKEYFVARELMSPLAAKQQLAVIRVTQHKSSKSKEPREVHQSTYGYFCVFYTVEGAKTGLVIALTVNARIANGTPTTDVVQLIRPGLQQFWVEPEQVDLHIPVWCNGVRIGNVAEVTPVRRAFEAIRRRHPELATVSIYFDRTLNGLFIRSTSGRCLKPVFVMDQYSRLAALVTQFHQLGLTDLSAWLSENGLIQWMDAWEESSSHVTTAPSLHEALGNGASHAHLHSTCILGLVASTIPFANHNQAPRNTYYSGAMHKQAMSADANPAEPRHIAETTHYSLLTAQRPMVQTFLERETMAPQKGFNAVVWICDAGGFNIEDGIVVNQAAIDRGMGQYLGSQNQNVRIPVAHGHHIVCKPDPTTTVDMIQPRNGVDRYRKIQANGLPQVGTIIEKGDVLVGRIKREFDEGCNDEGQTTMVYRDHSEVSEHSGRVQMVCSKTSARARVITITLSHLKSPLMGDKFASRHGQKSTIAVTLPQVDLPFSELTGMSPDIIMNPHCIPSRMTVGHLLEMVGGKAGAVSGRSSWDGTAFQTRPLDAIQTTLREYGFDQTGTERVRCGKTGKLLKMRVFTGVVYYHSLAHIAKTKCYARGSRGPVVRLTQQPNSGRKNCGSNRFGELPRDAVIGHGAEAVYQDYMCQSSDGMIAYICEDCGQMANAPPEIQTAGARVVNVCPNPECQSTEVFPVQTTHCNKLFVEILNGMNIKSTFKLNEL